MVDGRHHPTHWFRRFVKPVIPRRVLVAGRSMLPTFEPGDRLLILPVRRPKPGQVIAVRDPRQPERIMIKRVVRTDGHFLHVEGDNPADSTDSRQFGLVPVSMAVGRVAYRYAPQSRSGWWPQ